MIPHDTIQQILDTARVEEVVGDFVSLKRRGSNFIGLCPFHNEKTPSFHVSPTKGIYKCFGCGKAGNSVGFVMDHEKFTYPEALRYLAKKYHIEIQEEEETAEKLAERTEREALLSITEFAGKFFIDQLHNTDEGKSVGLSYFHDRGFSDDTIREFQLGYSPDSWDAFCSHALKNGYSAEMIEKSGLGIKKDNDKFYDRFRGRVIFPIHNQSGRIIGFGGRIMTSDKSKPKYVNSPESEIYNKSKTLYGISLAKHAISANDMCYLVEGYTDVISLHKSGIQNVVASSGTSLTVDQIRLIKRYTPNITVLYDGDPAGIKASFRGIDMILEQGMNVKALLFPDGEDPDSFARKRRSSEVQEFIQKNSLDFISFKIDLLLRETNNDPILKVKILKEFIESISLMPDPLTRLAYVRETAERMQMDEKAILNELNKALRKKFNQHAELTTPEATVTENLSEYEKLQQPDNFNSLDTEELEREIIRQLLLYGEENIQAAVQNELSGEEEIGEQRIFEYIINDILADELYFSNVVYQRIFDTYISELKLQSPIDFKKLTHNPDTDIATPVIDIIANKYTFSPNWEKRKIKLLQEHEVLDILIPHSLLSFKAKKIRQVLKDLMEKIKTTTTDDEINDLLEQFKHAKETSMIIDGKMLGRTIV